MITAISTTFASIGLTGGLLDIPLIRATQNMKVASITFALLELFATLPDEARFIWTSDWSTMKVIFLINKYSVLPDTVMTIWN
ncbi:hypothetical protein V8D89_000997 [Ganoderma adspersum]